MELSERTAETAAVDGSFNIHEMAIPKPSRYGIRIEPAVQNVNRYFAQPALNFFEASPQQGSEGLNGPNE
jgi:hypothetical protein